MILSFTVIAAGMIYRHKTLMILSTNSKSYLTSCDTDFKYIIELHGPLAINKKYFTWRYVVSLIPHIM